MTTRRGFLQTCLAASAAPAIIKIEVLGPMFQRRAVFRAPMLAGMVRELRAYDIGRDGWYVRHDATAECEYI